MDISAIKIQKMWKKTTSTLNLLQISTVLKGLDLQDLSNKLKCINDYYKGDGCGLTGGSAIDAYICSVLKTNVLEYEEFHKDESDIKICDIPLSLKRITGKSSIALSWSKNKIENKKEKFSSHIIIINLKTEQWWKNGMNNDIIKSGIYIIDKKYCKKYITLTSNNKTNDLIDSHKLYKMLKRSIQQNHFIELPIVDKTLIYNPFTIGAFL